MADSNNTAIKVLHVDDDQSFLDVSKLIFAEINSSLVVDGCISVQEALEKMTHNDYDVVVSDYEMPNQNGLDFLIELKKKGNAQPFILFTGKGREEIAMKALNLGADGYFNKQGNPEVAYGELVHGIKNVFARKEAEKKSKREEALRTILLDNLPCTALILEKNTRLIVASNKIAQAQGAIPGKTCYDTCAKRNLPCSFCLAPKVWETNQPEALEVQYRGKHYRGVWVPYSDELYAHYIFDIDDEKKAQSLLEESLSNYHSLINGMNETAWVIDLKGNILEVNDAAVEVLGYSKEELFSVGLGGIDRNLSREQIKKLIDNLPIAKRQVFETVHTSKDGVNIPVEISSSLILYRGKPAVLSIARNVTQRKKDEQLLRAQEQQWVTTLKSIGDAVITTNADGKIQFMNPVAEQLTGWSLQAARDQSLSSVFRIVNEETGLTEEDPVAKVIKTGYIVGLANHTLLVRKDGCKVPVDDSGAPIFNETGVISGVVLIFRDITAKRMLERELAVSQQKYKSLFSMMREGVCLHELVYDAAGKAVDYKILDVNAAYEAITGLTHAQAVGKTASVLYGTGTAPYIDVYAEVAGTGKSTTFETYFPPMEKHFRISVYSPGKDRFATVFFDVTESKKAEEALKQVAGERETLLRGARFVLSNQTFEETARNLFDACKNLIGATAGYVALLSDDGSENKVLFLDAGGLSCSVDKNLPMPIRGLRETAYRTGKVVYENDFSGSDWMKFMPKGHVSLSNVMFAPLIINDKAVGLMGLANKPSAFNDRDAKLAANFGEYAAMALNNSWAMASLQTREKEIIQTLQRLNESHHKLKNLNEKLQVIGSLTRHDVRNKLSAIQAYTYLLKKRYSDDSELVKTLEAIEVAVRQSSKIFDFSSIYEKIGVEQPCNIVLAGAINQAADLLPHASVEVANETHGLTVLADSMLTQLFYNLIDNTLRHGKTADKIKIHYSKSEVGTHIFYEDNGVGIPQENKAKIFSERFTTGGSGLGLKLVKKMIESYGWNIQEIGVPGEGVKFEITIPKH